MGNGASRRERRRREQIEQDNLEHKRTVERERLKIELQNQFELEKLKLTGKDKDGDREITREKMRLESQRTQAMVELLKESIGKLPECDMNFTLAIGQIIHGVANKSPLDSETFKAIASRVPAALPPNIETVVEDVIRECNKHKNSSSDLCSDDDGINSE